MECPKRASLRSRRRWRAASKCYPESTSSRTTSYDLELKSQSHGRLGKMDWDPAREIAKARESSLKPKGILSTSSVGHIEFLEKCGKSLTSCSKLNTVRCRLEDAMSALVRALQSRSRTLALLTSTSAVEVPFCWMTVMFALIASTSWSVPFWIKSTSCCKSAFSFTCSTEQQSVKMSDLSQMENDVNSIEKGIRSQLNLGIHFWN